MQLSDRELATVLAALRLFQRLQLSLNVEEMEHFAHEQPLTPEEIDQLCEKLNCIPVR